MHAKRITRTALAVVAAVAVGLLAPGGAAPAGAAGVTTHAWMGLRAIDEVTSPSLRALLTANQGQVHAGAQFPDSGYVLDGTYGEEAHWQRFHNAYADRIRARSDCGAITSPTGPCAAQIAHLMGLIAHGMGDQVWDWLYEPYMAQHDEYYFRPEWGAVTSPHSSELVLDLVAIGRHGRPNPARPNLPRIPDLIAAFAAAGLPGVTADELNTGHLAMGVINDVEHLWAAEHADAVVAAMPWTAHNMVDGPGGVTYAAVAIAGAWEAMWGRLQGAQPATRISVTHPADGQRRVPATGWAGSYNPGSAPGNGGGDTRISAAATYALPFTGASGPGPVTTTLPAGAMTLTAVDSGTPVPTLPGFPRSVPYGSDAGHHNLALQPGVDLAPCTWYRVDVTDALVDADGRPFVPHSWTFRTGLDGEGRRCPDDPFTAQERYVQAAYRDLLGRTADTPGLEGWTHGFARGLTPARFSNNLIGTVEHRRRLASAAYTSYLGRPADVAGRDHWAGELRTRTLTWVRSRILGSAEVYQRAGGTDAAYVEELYRLVLGRAADGPGLAHWSAQLGAGLPRATLAARLLASPEVSRRTVRTTFAILLGRSPEEAAEAHWAPRVAAADERVLVTTILRSPEYVARAQRG